jgi:hypothetical protein
VEWGALWWFTPGQVSCNILKINISWIGLGMMVIDSDLFR